MTRPKTRVAVLTLAALAIGWWAGNVSQAQPPRPNIVIVMADDMGYSDIGSYGGEIQTPNLDRLAKEGVRYSQFYNNALCGPSRAALMTGLDPHRVGVVQWTGVLNDRGVTLFELLKTAGYTTCVVGRPDMVTVEDWRDPANVRKYVDRFLSTFPTNVPGVMSGGHYFKDVRNRQFWRDGSPFPLPPGTYATDLITGFAVDFIGEAAKGEQPFFLYVSHYAPHWPLHAKPEDMAKYGELYRDLGWDRVRSQRHRRLVELGLLDRDTPLSARDARVPAWEEAEQKTWEADRMAAYAAQVDSLDQSVGQIMDTLRRLGVEENTLVVFFSDNGASDGVRDARWDTTWRVDGTPTQVGNLPTSQPGHPDTFMTAGPPWSNVSNTPFRGHKPTGATYEGGIATPFIAWWPRVIESRGAICHEISHITDITATVLAVAGVEYPEHFDGRTVLPQVGQSLLPDLRGEARSAGPRTLCWDVSGNRAIRTGPWKLVSIRGQDWQLFNLETDRTEQNDVADQHPERVEAMAKAFHQWKQGP